MRIVADLHIHSRYSLATSPSMDIPTLAHWARRKGIDLVGTGDFTHPEWRGHLKAELRSIGDGLPSRDGIQFLPTAEVAVVWRYEGKGRRLHLLLLAPSIEAAARAARAVGRFGSLASNGRPMLSAGCQPLLEAIWHEAPEVEVIPAHIWTPWYSLFGSRSGFDDLTSCFGPHADRVHAVETGLSSDPAMNARVRQIDRLTLVSFSDAHAPSKLGREATVLDLPDVTYGSLVAALRGDGPGRVVETLEVPPEHGKYHFDGHRACGVALSPKEARALANRCPSCGKPLTLGVLHRVEALADRPAGAHRPFPASYRTLLPLVEVVAGLLSRSVSSRCVAREVERLTARYGTELAVLRDVPIADLNEDPLIGLGATVATLRGGRLRVRPGYDGVYGTVVWPSDEDGPG
jgi:uncharacterized protein (TIGR00375 family)